MPLAVATGRQLASSFYARAPRRTYFSGCSNGGRLGMYAAQRHPELFDGIAAGGGIFDLTGNSWVHGLWLLQTTRDERGRAVISQAKLPQLVQTVVQQCDGLDGVEDGLIARPDRCSVDLSELDCELKAKPGCFTLQEITAIGRLYRGANVDDRQLFPGIPPGSEVLWDRWIVGTDEERAWGERAAEGNLRLTYGIPSSEPFNPHDYVLADELQNLQRWAPVLNATDPDLSDLADEGGKLFYYHGLADPLIIEGRARQYYREAVAVMGRDRLDGVARFVMVPGHGHCWEKPGQVADAFDPLEIIDRWVENGEAPDSVVADYVGDGPPRSRRLCALPRRAEHMSGDSADAQNFRCR
jgi:feruloyl esterase